MRKKSTPVSPQEKNIKKEPKKASSRSIIAHFIEKVNTSRFRPLWITLFLLLWTLLSIISSQILFYLIFSNLAKGFTDSTALTALYDALCYSFSLFLLIFVPWKLFKKLKPSRESLGLKGLPTFVDLGLAPVGFLAYYLLAALLTSLFTIFPWFNLEEAQNVGFNFLTSSGDYLITFFALVLIAPIAEELIFRGWLYGHLREKLPKKVSLPLSIILVSVLFGFLHGQWNVGVNVFAMSLVLCGLREITGTVYSGIFLHVIKNALAFYLVYVLGLG